AEQDVIGRFLGEATRARTPQEIEAAGGRGGIRTSDLYSRYQSWAKELGVPVLRQQDFVNDLVKRGWVHRHTDVGNFWVSHRFSSLSDQFPPRVRQESS